MIEHLAIEPVERITFGKSFVNQEIVIVRVPSLKLFLSYHLQVLELIYQTVSDAMHKFLDAFLENIEQDIWCDLEAPLFESFCESQELLKVLRELVIIVYTIEAELDI